MNAAWKEEIIKYLEEGRDLNEVIRRDDRWEMLYYFSEMRRNLLEWYVFEPGSVIVELGAECGALSVLFAEKAARVICCERDADMCDILELRCADLNNVEICRDAYPEEGIKADYIMIQDGMLEEHSLEEILKRCKDYAKEDTKYILAADNRMGLRYWNGSTEYVTGKTFEGLMDYPEQKGKYAYTRPELVKEFAAAGITDLQFYYPMPDHRIAINIYSDDYLPGSGVIRNVTAAYDRDRYELFREEPVYDTLCKDGQFPYFANAFLVFANAPKIESGYIRVNRQRCAAFRTHTEVVEKNKERHIEKRALGAAAQEHMERFYANQELLARMYPNLKVLPSRKLSDGISYAYLSEQTVEEWLKQENGFSWEYMEQMRSMVHRIFAVAPEFICPFEMSEEYKSVFGETAVPGGAVLGANVDMAFDNIVMAGDSLIMIDYEWTFSFAVPKNYPMYRSLSYFYDRNDVFFKGHLDKTAFMEHMGISESEMEAFDEMELHFQEYVRGVDLQDSYLERYKKMLIPFGEYEELKAASMQKDQDIAHLNEIIYSNNEYIAGLEALIQKYHDNPVYKIMGAVRSIWRRS